MIHAAYAQAGFDRVFISATPGDEGIALGCATCAAGPAAAAAARPGGVRRAPPLPRLPAQPLDSGELDLRCSHGPRVRPAPPGPSAPRRPFPAPNGVATPKNAGPPPSRAHPVGAG